MQTSRFESEWSSRPATLTAKQLLERGVSRGQLRGNAWRQVRYGQYAPAEPDRIPADTQVAFGAAATQRVLDCAPLIVPGIALGGWAAAFVHGVDWLDGVNSRTGRTLPIDLVGTTVKRRSGGGVRYRYSALDGESELRLGLSVTTPFRTAVDGARWSETVEDALVFLDAMVHFGRLRLDDFRAHVAQLRLRRGIDQLRAAAELTRDNVGSPWETRLRYCYLTEAGLPEPLLNVGVYDSEDGKLLGYPDLFEPEAALAVEFDGEPHRDRERHRRDNLREEGLESAGVTVVRTDSLDLRGGRRGQTIHRMQDGHQRGLRRDRSNDRWILDPRVWT